jgi:iron complex transport system ATP-binding protein
MPNDSIVLSGVSYRYPRSGRTVLKDISLRIRSGTTTAILGPNGSGKTTLLKLMAGLLSPLKGSIALHRRDAREMTPLELAVRVAWVSQMEANASPIAVDEYVMLGQSPRIGLFDMPRPRQHDIVRKTLADMGISRLSGRAMNALSGGEVRLVTLARAVAQQTPCILLDEPTTHLDLANKGRLLTGLRRMARSGKTIAFSTHDPNEAMASADTVALLKEGRVLSFGPPRTVLTEQSIEALFATRVCRVSQGETVLFGTFMK